jgi:hypothetical protein
MRTAWLAGLGGLALAGAGIEARFGCATQEQHNCLAASGSGGVRYEVGLVP